MPLGGCCAVLGEQAAPTDWGGRWWGTALSVCSHDDSIAGHVIAGYVIHSLHQSGTEVRDVCGPGCSLCTTHTFNVGCLKCRHPYVVGAVTSPHKSSSFPTPCILALTTSHLHKPSKPRPHSLHVTPHPLNTHTHTYTQGLKHFGTKWRTIVDNYLPWRSPNDLKNYANQYIKTKSQQVVSSNTYLAQGYSIQDLVANQPAEVAQRWQRVKEMQVCGLGCTRVGTSVGCVCLCAPTQVARAREVTDSQGECLGTCAGKCVVEVAFTTASGYPRWQFKVNDCHSMMVCLEWRGNVLLLVLLRLRPWPPPTAATMALSQRHQTTACHIVWGECPLLASSWRSLLDPCSLGRRAKDWNPNTTRLPHSCQKSEPVVSS